MSDAITRTLAYDGLSFSYQLLRSASPVVEPVLAIGGVLQGMHGWSIMQQHVLPHADLISMDLPGSGAATPLNPRQKMETMCRAVDVILDDLGIERVNFLGYSFGSAVAYRCAQDRPERIARLALGVCRSRSATSSSACGSGARTGCGRVTRRGWWTSSWRCSCARVAGPRSATVTW